MEEFITYTQIDEAAHSILQKITINPQVGIILGSGLGELANQVKDAVNIPYDQIPHMPSSTVAGHQGRFVVGKLANRNVLLMQGRIHYYEGYSVHQVTFPIRIMQRLGVSILIITNAAGGINQDFEPGDLMLITDHINLLGMTAGGNPLRGPNLDEFGVRFPDMSRVYDPQLLKLAHEAGKQQGIHLREGIYICLAGPSFETPADLRFLKAIGADAVGMSTVPEATVARHGGMRILGISGISNKASLDGNKQTTHQEVMETGAVLVPKLQKIILGVLERLD